MVEQPKFYYRVVPLKTEKIDGADGYHLRRARYYISDTPKAGFKVHPAFVRNGIEIDRIYLSAFDGCIYDVSVGAYLLEDEQAADFDNDMLSSIAGAKPCSVYLLQRRGKPLGKYRKVVDGINVFNPTTWSTAQNPNNLSGTIFAADNNFTDSVNSKPYYNIGIPSVYGSGYVLEFGYSTQCDWVFIATEFKGNSVTPRGSQYTSEKYRRSITGFGIVQSMNSAGGKCHDNARCESMRARMKEDLFYLRGCKSENFTVDELKTFVRRYFMSYWNDRRICSTIGGIPPAEKRRRYYATLRSTA
ncbi:MAG: hypothetical protein NC401_20070 [Ruminococcus sp.]|nr:hypothetical protein [Ruminococcus sp.]